MEMKNPMYKIKILVRLLEGGEITGGYARQIELPFIPQLGMRFEKWGSCHLWETEDGQELISPEVERVIYDIDEEEIVCVFTVTGKLASSFWTELRIAELGDSCFELRYFRGM